MMQGLADGYFVLPATVANYLAEARPQPVNVEGPEFREVEGEVRARIKRLMAVNGTRSVDSFHKELGKLVWVECGMARTAESLRRALARIPQLREEFWRDVRVLGDEAGLNQSLEKAGRVADFLEFAELMVLDALHREESCGGHFREEYQTEEGEAERDDEIFAYVAAWLKGADGRPELAREPLTFENVHLATRSYK